MDEKSENIGAYFPIIAGMALATLQHPRSRPYGAPVTNPSTSEITRKLRQKRKIRNKLSATTKKRNRP